MEFTIILAGVGIFLSFLLITLLLMLVFRVSSIRNDIRINHDLKKIKEQITRSNK